MIDVSTETKNTPLRRRGYAHILLSFLLKFSILVSAVAAVSLQDYSVNPVLIDVRMPAEMNSPNFTSDVHQCVQKQK